MSGTEEIENVKKDSAGQTTSPPGEDTALSVDDKQPVVEEKRIPRLSLFSFLLIVSTGLLFIVSLCPTVYVGDAGDFITACYKKWIPHPPGYPVYTVLGHALTLIPTSFCEDSVALKRFLALLFLSVAGLVGIVMIIRGKDHWGNAIKPYLGYIIGGFIGIVIAKTIHAFLSGADLATGGRRGFDIGEPVSLFFILTMLAFFAIVLAVSLPGIRSSRPRLATYIVSIVLFCFLSPVIYLMIRYLVPPTVDPINSHPALMVNLLSAIGGFLTITFVYLTLREIIPVEPVCGIAAFLIAIGRTFWAQAEIAEVYTLNTLFIFAIFYLGFTYIRTRREWRFYLMALLMGIAISHHYSILLFYPGLLYYIAVKTGGIAGLRRSFRPLARVAVGLMLSVIGLFPYLYLSYVHYETPLEYVVFSEEEQDSLRESGLEKVRYEKAGEWDYFTKFASRGVYSEARAHEKTEANRQMRTTTPMVFNRYVELTTEEFTIPLAIFGLVGFLLCLRFRPGWLLLVWIISLLFVLVPPVTLLSGGPKSDLPQFLLYGGERLIWFVITLLVTIWLMRSTARIVFGCAFLLYFGVVHFYPSEDILFAPMINLQVVMPPLVVPLFVFWACFVAFFVSDIYLWVIGYTAATSKQDSTDPRAKTAVFQGLILTMFILLTLFAGYVNWPFGDKSRSTLSYNYARNVLDSVDPLTVVMTTGDEIFIFWYLKEVEGYRSDVQVTNWIHNIYDMAELGNELEAMSLAIDRFIYSTRASGWNLVSTYLVSEFNDYESIMNSHVVMDGLMFRYEPRPPPGIAGRVRFGKLPPRERMNVIDEVRDQKLDPSLKPPEGYYWGGMNPLVDSAGFEDYARRSVYLDPQEKEMINRYQDVFLHAGIFRIHEGKWFEEFEEYELAYEQYMLAARHLRSLVSLKPSDYIGWLELGETFLLTQNPENAEKCFKTLISKENAPDSLKGEAHAALAFLYLKMGDKERAKWETEQAYIYDKTIPRADFVRKQLMGKDEDSMMGLDEDEGTDGDLTNDE